MAQPKHADLTGANLHYPLGFSQSLGVATLEASEADAYQIDFDSGEVAQLINTTANQMHWGNSTDNPAYSFNGSGTFTGPTGLMTASGDLAVTGEIFSNGDYVRIAQAASDPSVVSTYGYVYAKDVSGDEELFFRSSAGVVQITSGGAVNGGGAAFDGDLDEALLHINADTAVTDEDAEARISGGDGTNKQRLREILVGSTGIVHEYFEKDTAGNDTYLPNNTLIHIGTSEAGSTASRSSYTRWYGGTGSVEDYVELGSDGGYPRLKIPTASARAFAISNFSGVSNMVFDGQNRVTTAYGGLRVRDASSILHAEFDAANNTAQIGSDPASEEDEITIYGHRRFATHDTTATNAAESFEHKRSAVINLASSGSNAVMAIDLDDYYSQDSAGGMFIKISAAGDTLGRQNAAVMAIGWTFDKAPTPTASVGGQDNLEDLDATDAGNGLSIDVTTSGSVVNITVDSPSTTACNWVCIVEWWGTEME